MLGIVNARPLPPREVRPPAPPRPPDYKLPAGANARPPGRGWLLIDYAWDEGTGVGRAQFRRRWDPKQRLTVEVQQPAGPHHEGWKIKPPINREAMLARYFESQRKQMEMQADGVYGR